MSIAALHYNCKPEKPRLAQKNGIYLGSSDFGSSVLLNAAMRNNFIIAAVAD
jgi:hypothetical protein